MPQGTYTFGPPSGAGAPAVDPTKKKQAYTFGEPGKPPVQPLKGAGDGKPPAQAAPVVQAPKMPSPSVLNTKHANPPLEQASPFMAGVLKGGGFDASKLNAQTNIKIGDTLYPATHPAARIGAEMVKEAAQGLGDWMDAVAGSKTISHLASEIDKPFLVPLGNLAKTIEFHTGEKWDAFGLKKAGIDETALERIARGLKTGNGELVSNGAGEIVGALSTVLSLEKGPTVVDYLRHVPGEAKDVVSAAKEARNKAVVTAAANNQLHVDVRQIIAPMIKRNVDAINNGIAREAQAVISKDRAVSATSGQSAFQAVDIAKTFQNANVAKNTTKVPTPETTALVKSFSQTIKKHGQNLSWEDVKDLRSQVFNSMQKASLKDKAVLGQVYNELTSKLSDRAKQVSATSEFENYSKMQSELRRHDEGIVSTLKNADTGLKTYEVLAKASNRPELNDFFHLSEKNGGAPLSFVDEMVKTRKPLFELAKRADQGESAGGRMGAILRHPKAAGTAMIGTGAALSTLSPIPLTGSFVASLVAAQKVANFMDRYDAARALQEIRRAPQRVPPTPITPVSPRGGGTSPAPPPPGGATPSSPVSTAPPSTPSGPASPTGAPVGVGAPAAPASLDELMSRISNAQKAKQAVAETKPTTNTLNPDYIGTNPTEGLGVGSGRPRFTHTVVVKPSTYETGKWEVLEQYHHTDEQYPAMRVHSHGVFDSELAAQKYANKIKPGYQGITKTKPTVKPEVVDVDKLAKGMREKGQDSGFADQRAKQIADMLAHPEKYNPSEVAVARSARGMWEGPERRSVSKQVDVERRGADALDKPTETTPYSQFGVKIDKSKLTTPEAVRAAKEDATHQIEEIARNKYKMVQGISDVADRQTALKKLEKEMTAAKRSVDKLQTPGVSRGARDRLRKAEDASKVKPSGALDHLNPEEVDQKAAKGVTNDEAVMMEVIDLTREAEKFGPVVLGVVNKILRQAGGSDAAALPTLRALMEQVRKAKK